jgi:predicted DNA-binding protein
MANKPFQIRLNETDRDRLKNLSQTYKKDKSEILRECLVIVDHLNTYMKNNPAYSAQEHDLIERILSRLSM